MSNRPVVISIGEVVWDIFEHEKRIGGAPANFAHFMAGFGFPTYLISAVGQDSLGIETIGLLTQSKINTRFISQLSTYPTGRVKVHLDSANNAKYEIEEDVAWDHLQINRETLRLSETVSVICFGTLGSRSKESAEAINTLLSLAPKQALKILDINLRQTYFNLTLIQRLLKHASILKLSSEELPVLTGLLSLPKMTGETDTLCYLLEAYCLKLIILTKGAAGSRLIGSGEDSTIKGSEVKGLVDTVGAGDSFTSAVTRGLLLNLPIHEIHSNASDLAKYVCQNHGAMPPIPESYRV